MNELVKKMDDNSCQKFDNAFFSILQECKELPAFLDAIFGFLNRRTDFYCIADGPQSPVGLPKGWAEEYVKRAFFKWQPAVLNKNKNDKKQETIAVETVKKDSQLKSEPCEIKQKDEGKTKDKEKEKDKRVDCKEKFTSSDFYNGAKYEKYSWSQTINEIDINVKVPCNVSKKELLIDIKSNCINVRLKRRNNSNNEEEEELLLNGELCHKIKQQEAIWSLDNKCNLLIIHLEKAAEYWWDCLTIDEPKLDLKKVDCSRPYEELSQEAQSKIEELTWNQERKMKGLPTSDELAMHEKLKKAWDLPGSPFKGTEFDPSSVQF